ncbi:protein phosphatase 1 regulatory subunit 3B isoform X2 [Hyalella azteca]|uniref:Protein phosphatase 1 regulatory subunit 3B isoform X2 n=1 Tax=Hyalella azteca TaxID=294128 RepID=A0A8B7P3T0_HYAAZ|nr:protein phosphatase 1 regulatory subunit 3B isoform X2 [Hyalella azteca]
MTACTMPSDYGAELMLGSSPVMGSGFHGTGSSFFSEYPRCGSPSSMWGDQGSYYPSPLTGSYSDLNAPDPCRSFARTGSLRRPKKLNKIKKDFPKPLLLTIPAKSILRSPDEFPQEEDAVATSPNREKKRVAFADTLGHTLAQIKVITERPDCPPFWSAEFIEKVTGGFSAEKPPNRWELTFSQPVSDYMGFKLRLDRENVALENVVIEETQGIVKGTVKVRNLSFHKDVLVRYSSDAWLSSRDVSGVFIPAPTTSVAYDLYDRFSFEIPLPEANLTDKLEFCVRFSCDGREYWDNNSGRNYVAISFRSKNDEKKNKTNDAYQLSLDSWTEFASWNHLSLDDSPYW